MLSLVCANSLVPNVPLVLRDVQVWVIGPFRYLSKLIYCSMQRFLLLETSKYVKIRARQNLVNLGNFELLIEWEELNNVEHGIKGEQFIELVILPFLHLLI